MTGIRGAPRFPAPTAESVFPAGPGAYALAIRLDRAFSGDIGAPGRVDLAAGHCLYLGSARGPGGLAARHRRTDWRRCQAHPLAAAEAGEGMPDALARSIEMAGAGWNSV